MSGQFAIKVTVAGVPQFVSRIRKDGKNLGLCGQAKDGLLFGDYDKAVKSSQKAARIFQTRTIGVIPRIEVVVA